MLNHLAKRTCFTILTIAGLFRRHNGEAVLSAAFDKRPIYRLERSSRSSLGKILLLSVTR